LERNDEQRLTTADMAGVKASDGQETSGYRADQHTDERTHAGYDGGDTGRPRTDQIARSELHEDDRASLLGDGTHRYSEKWQSIQVKFVDEPQDSVKEADSLVAEVVQELATKFAEQRKHLEEQWSSGSEVSTEDLRQALQQYRSFFQRLLAA
jgi:hypothetical protein